MRGLGLVSGICLVACVPLVGVAGLAGGLAVGVGAGQQGSATSGVVACETGGMTVTARDGNGHEVSLGEVQVDNVAVVISAGQELGHQAQKVALVTALQESALRNLANDGSFRYPTGSGVMSSAEWETARETVMTSMSLPHDGVGSDWDSIGLFQQRPSAGWGTVEQIMDRATSARTFYERLGQVEGWDSMSAARAAQAVQVSQFPAAYAKWEPVADALLAALADVSCSGGGAPGGNVSIEGLEGRSTVVRFALSQLGDRYVWGAEGPDAWDCSGLVQGAYAQVGVHLPHYSGDIRRLGTVISASEAQPGDVMWWPGHVALYLGGGELVGAQGYSQGVVRIPVYGSPTYLRFL